MTTVPVLLSTAVAVVPSQKIYAKLGPALHPLALIEEMSSLARLGTLPARLDDGRLVVYTSRHVAWLYPSNRGDAYSLGSAVPRTFRDEERLVAAALLIRCQYGWQAFQHVRDVRLGMSAHWDLLMRAWAQAEAPVTARSQLPPSHARYLDLMSRVIEAGRDIEVAKQHGAEPLLYRNKASAREERHSARDVYTFQLLRSADVAEGAVLYVRERPELRGRVKRLKGAELTIRFERAIDYGQVPASGALMAMPSDRIFQAQADAVTRLREGRSANPRLLHQLVNRQVSPYEPDGHAQPREPLDRESGQLAAFQRALGAPDMLLVLGPPGTGKTRTIAQIVTACAGRQRVLITSHTNRAVDNVLEKLPEDVFTVRIGNEDKMSAHAKSLIVETRVQQEQSRILAGTEGTAAALAAFSGPNAPAQRWLSYLAQCPRQRLISRLHRRTAGGRAGSSRRAGDRAAGRSPEQGRA
ncbi:hypothetical protein Aple_040220 [Acrocarpospora pleiomorpha]|uniref:DNA2/NAM7 helicase helicase domain-containing protein n=1 Tax=Acrocarpospora pleiomorpha TaxID=90975 RepID=A0A5M3XK51_9ACTN|nr:AAA domain-containing protein [Acrocarpospora pleiomorpha]GES21126.1 hypothetical protein Aple_040220 [Acrocarpospora pleiomorpha]